MTNNGDAIDPREIPHSRQLIIYRPPRCFTALEVAIFNHGTFDQRRQVFITALCRSLGLPAHVFEADANYSSSRFRRDRIHDVDW